jgi:hypothetical protein
LLSINLWLRSTDRWEIPPGPGWHWSNFEGKRKSGNLRNLPGIRFVKRT